MNSTTIVSKSLWRGLSSTFPRITMGICLLAACDMQASKAQRQGEEQEQQNTATRSSSETTTTEAATPLALHPNPPTSAGTSDAANPQTGIVPLTPSSRLQDEENTISVFKTAAPATVFVTQKALVRDRWSLQVQEIKSGTGTGFIWDRQGHIVTNAHVVAPQRGNRNPNYEITLYNGKTYSAKLRGMVKERDIAVLKIDAPTKDLTPIHLPPDQYSLQVGQKTLAIGNPFGLDHSLTVGVISALNREVKGFGDVTIQGMIQTDASINPGNSGGPLLNSSGELVGMNTMIYSKSGSSAGIGFAVPIKIIKRLVPQLVKRGYISRAGLGIDFVDERTARQNGVDQGVIVRSVAPRTPAAAAGLQGLQRGRQGVYIGDIILAIEGNAVSNFDQLYNALEPFSPGDTVRVKVQRDGKSRTLNIKLIDLSAYNRRQRGR